MHKLASSLALLVLGVGCASHPQCPRPSEASQRELIQLAEMSASAGEEWRALNGWVGQMAAFCEDLREAGK